MSESAWPLWVGDRWQSTYETLHRWAQIVGKTRLALSPPENHWWHTALYVTTRGLTTSPMPSGDVTVSVDFDFVADALIMQVSDGRAATLALRPRSVADYYGEYRDALSALDVSVHLVGSPNEVIDATPFAEDVQHASYDGAAAREWWQALTNADRALKEFRGQFTGKCSPSHFWWGGFDLACTRFSGRRAPRHPGGVPNCPDWVMHEAYSRECISSGWWPGTPGSSVPEPAFYCYAYPEPAGCASAQIWPAAARYDGEMREWILPYEAVRRSSDPFGMVSEFLQSTYSTAASLANWDAAAGLDDDDEA
jgi:hypothetical protein